MAYRDHVADLNTCLRDTRRILVNGPPNSHKTGSLRTLKGKGFILSAPFEGGITSIPWTNFEGIPIIAKVPDIIDVSKRQNWQAIVNDVWDLTIKALSGEFGKIDWFALDGAHKLYSAMLATQCDGANLTGEDFLDAKGQDAMGRAYGKTHTQFFRYIWTLVNSNVDKIVITCWDGADKDNKLNTDKNAPKHNYPDLPGMAAKKIMGEMPVVLSAGWDVPTAQGRYFWRTRPLGYDYGAGIKLPVDIMIDLKLPGEVTQDFEAWDKTVTAHVTRKWNELKAKEVA